MGIMVRKASKAFSVLELSNMRDTLTRVQAECTKLLLEKRELVERITQLELELTSLRMQNRYGLPDPPLWDGEDTWRKIKGPTCLPKIE